MKLNMSLKQFTEMIEWAANVDEKYPWLHQLRWILDHSYIDDYGAYLIIPGLPSYTTPHSLN